MARRIHEHLERLRGRAEKRASTTRAIAVWSAHIRCGLATLAFAAEVDLDRLLQGTSLAHSPEGDDLSRALCERLRAKRCQPLRELLAEALGTTFPSRTAVSLRDGVEADPERERTRADRTLMCLHHVIHRHPNAPRLIDGAVLRTRIGGVEGHFETEGISVEVDGRLHVCEICPVPKEASRPSAGAWRTTIRRAAIHIALLREMSERLDASPSTVSPVVFVAHPNPSGQITLTAVDLKAPLAAFRRVQRTIPAIDDLIATLPRDATFTSAADTDARDEERFDALATLAHRTGIRLVPSCATTCGNTRFCRTLHRERRPATPTPKHPA